jgi:hypothetical protein
MSAHHIIKIQLFDKKVSGNTAPAPGPGITLSLASYLVVPELDHE